MILSKDFIKNVFVYFFHCLLCIRKGSLFYCKFNESLFKLINAFSPCANSLAPSSPIELLLNFGY